MRILFVYPEYPDTFFSFSHALRFVGKRAAVSPLGPITISAMLPSTWQKRLVDLNVEKLNDADLEWADCVAISAMYVQKDSVKDIVARSQSRELMLIAGGPLFNREYQQYPEIDHFILGEGEISFRHFLKDLEMGDELQKVYEPQGYANLDHRVLPDYQLLDLKSYASINIQFSRGCPFDCDFCEIPSLLGHQVRIKKTQDILDEFQKIYELGWRGSVSVVDDNFIGNKKIVKEELLPAIRDWMRERKYPFVFNVQTSLDLADDPELIRLMVEAGINSTFIGIESPAEEAIREGNKIQNRNKNMLECVRRVQSNGMMVSGGFILGFDYDPPDIFQQQISFIQQSGIVWAMVGLLNAPKGTHLYERLEKEKRLTTEATGSNTDYSMNFIPKMAETTLIEGYQMITKSIYAPKAYYTRVRQLFSRYQPHPDIKLHFDSYYLWGFIKSFIYLGIWDSGRGEYWKFIVWTLVHYPGRFYDAVMFTLTGYHFRRIFNLY